MWKLGKFKEALWRDSSGGQYTARELLQKLQQMKGCFVLLDGYSGAGKTTMLKKLQTETNRSSIRMSSQQVQDLLLQEIKEGKSLSLNPGGEEILILEDMDLLRGKMQTIEVIRWEIEEAVWAGKLVIITGCELRTHTPELIQVCERVVDWAYYEAVRPGEKGITGSDGQEDCGMLDDLIYEVDALNARYDLEICLDTIGEIYGDDVVERMAEQAEDVLRNIDYLLSLEFGADVSDICNRFGPILLYDPAEFEERVSALIGEIGENYVDALGEDMSPWETLM